MTRDIQRTAVNLARWTQKLGLNLSALFGSFVGLAFGIGAQLAWNFAFGGFLTLLVVGMVVVVSSAVGERVAPGDWRSGLSLSTELFLSQTTIYSLTVLLVTGLISLAQPIILSVELLALSMLPGLYLCSVLAILLSGPLYLRWLGQPGG